MNKTIDLPATWTRYVHIYGDANEFRLGWRWITVPFPQDAIYFSWIKFNTSQLTTLKIKEWQVVSASIRVNIQTPATVPCAIHRVIKNATQNLTYNTYDGSNSWSQSAGRGLDTDIVATPIANFTFSGTENSISLSKANLFDIHNANRPVFFWTNNSAPKDRYLVSDISQGMFIRVTYKYSGLAGDVTTF